MSPLTLTLNPNPNPTPNPNPNLTHNLTCEPALINTRLQPGVRWSCDRENRFNGLTQVTLNGPLTTDN